MCPVCRNGGAIARPFCRFFSFILLCADVVCSALSLAVHFAVTESRNLREEVTLESRKLAPPNSQTDRHSGERLLYTHSSRPSKAQPLFCSSRILLFFFPEVLFILLLLAQTFVRRRGTTVQHDGSGGSVFGESWIGYIKHTVDACVRIHLPNPSLIRILISTWRANEAHADNTRAHLQWLVNHTYAHARLAAHCSLPR